MSQKENKKKYFDRKIRERLDMAESLLDQDKPQEVENHLNWIEAVKKIKTYRQDKTRIYWPLLIALTSIILISLSIKLKVQTTYISMELKASGVKLFLKGCEKINTFKGSTFIANYIGIDQLTFLSDHSYEWASLYNKNLDKEPFQSDIKGERAELTDIKSVKHEEVIQLSISTYKDTTQIYLKGLQLDGRFRIKPTAETLDGNDYIRTAKTDKIIGAPLSTFFRTRFTEIDGIPIKIDFKENVEWSINNIDILRIVFEEEDPPGSGDWKPTIESGYIKILEKGDEVSLCKGDYLYINCKDCKKYELMNDGEKISFFLQGKVSKIVGGTQDFKVDYMPSWLEYLYHNKKFVIIWGAFGVIWGLLWSVKRIFTGQ